MRSSGSGNTIGGLLAAELDEGLLVAQLHRGRVAAEHLRGLEELLGGLELAFGGDDLGSPLAFGFGARAIARCMASGISTSLISTVVTLMPHGSVCSSMIRRRLSLSSSRSESRVSSSARPSTRPQGGLGDLRGGDRVGLHLGDGQGRVDDPEVGDGIHPGRHVVAGDDLLRRDGERDRAQVDPDQPVHERHQEHQPGPGDGPQPPQPEADAALVLPQHPGAEQRPRRPASDEHEQDHDRATVTVRPSGPRPRCVRLGRGDAQPGGRACAAGKPDGVRRKWSVNRCAQQPGGDQRQRRPQRGRAGWWCRTIATTDSSAARPTSTSTIPRWNRAASECGHGSVGRVISRPCCELGAVGLDRAGVADRGLGPVAHQLPSLVVLGGPQHLVLRAHPHVVLRVVAEPGGAVALGPGVAVPGQPVQGERDDEQEAGVAGEQQHLGRHGHRSAPARRRRRRSPISVNSTSPGSSMTWLPRGSGRRASRSTGTAARRRR